MTSPTLDCSPLGALGARVSGLDLDTADATTADAVLSALDDHLLLVFDAPALDDAGQQRFMELLGEPYIHPLARVGGSTEARCSHIVDDADHPPYQDQWHTDVTWDPEPPAIGSLRCIEMPETGGDTQWADVGAILDDLPPDLHRRLQSLDARHDMGRGLGFITKAGADITERTAAEYPGVERPVVATHPRTGRRYLNVNSGFTRSIVGLPAADGDALLADLFEAVATSPHQYRHSWTEGEFAIWDERATQHRALPDHYPARREMARFVVR